MRLKASFPVGSIVHRLKAKLLLRQGSAGAEAALGDAIAVARAQGARMWELRAARDLARCWVERGERRKACDLLVPVHGRFSEGCDTPDLKEAKALLDCLR